MTPEAPDPPPRIHEETGRPETEEERADRNLSDLLQELRVALPGVQVLFAFLLAVVFQQGFQRTTQFQKDVFLATILCTTASTIGLSLLAVAMCGAIALISDFIFGTTTAVLATIVMASAFLGFWFLGPIRRRQRLPPR
jgi:hypothetical protein